MEEKKYLNEETYQENKKKITRLAVIVLIVGVLIGGSLIVTGIVKATTAKTELTDKQTERTESDVQKEIDDIDTQINQIDLDITTLKNEKTKLQNEQSKIFQEDKGFSDRYYAKNEEITAKENEITLKENEKIKLESSKLGLEAELLQKQLGFDSVENEVSTSKSLYFYMFGAFIIIASCMISGSIYMFAKRREITAFTAQQVMPVAKEGIDEMAPTIGNVAKEISKGIKDGTKNNSDK